MICLSVYPLGVKTRDDLADLAVDELLEFTGMDAENAKHLIMAARAHWFTEESATPPAAPPPALQQKEAR